MTDEQLQTAILLDVVTRYINLKESTARRGLLIKYKNQPATFVIENLAHRGILRRKEPPVATTDEVYLPTAASFELCGNDPLREEARHAATVVLTTLQQMFIGEASSSTAGFGFEDLKRHVEGLFTNQEFDDATVKLGLYLAWDLRALQSRRWNKPDETEVEWFQISESVVNMPNPDKEWDRVMAGFRQPGFPAVEEREAPAEAKWEQLSRLGGGGQSDVFLVRSPARVTQRAACLRTIKAALGDGADFANAIWSYSRDDTVSELGAKKIFKIRDEGGERQALERLKQEFQILKENRPGLPKLLDSNEEERWIVTEYFPKKTVEDNLSLYKGNVPLALRAFRSLLNTVLALHAEHIVHRDIKPANVFVRDDDELVLGDFGIVYVPDLPERVTLTHERVGPRDFMPPWADTDERLEHVSDRFDVYSLGKLLWCMVSGRSVLKREYFKQPKNDLTQMLKSNPHVFMINDILERSVVEEEAKCESVSTIRTMVNSFLQTLARGGQLLYDAVPRPCHVCGVGNYVRDRFGPAASIAIRFWVTHGSPGQQTTSPKEVEVYFCNQCGHMQLFRTTP